MIDFFLWCSEVIGGLLLRFPDYEVLLVLIAASYKAQNLNVTDDGQIDRKSINWILESLQ